MISFPLKKASRFIFGYISILFIYCAGGFRGRQPLQEIPPETLINQMYEQVSKLTSFQGWGRWSTISSAGHFRGSMKIIYRSPDSLWIKIEGPFGIDLGVACVCGDSGLFYSPWENRIYKGSIQELSEYSIIPFTEIHPHFMFSFLGLISPSKTILDSLLSITIQDRHYLLNFQDQETIWVSSRGPHIVRWEKGNEGEGVVWRWEGVDFRKNGNVKIPKIIKMTSFPLKQQFTIFYEKVKTNKHLKKRWWHIPFPENVEVWNFRNH